MWRSQTFCRERRGVEKSDFLSGSLPARDDVAQSDFLRVTGLHQACYNRLMEVWAGLSYFDRIIGRSWFIIAMQDCFDG
jgi:hypothetical protein